MKSKNLIVITALIALALMLGACVRPSSGGASSVATQSSSVPNPVSTQSQLMKDIIAGTQTAMAVASMGGTATPGADAPAVDGTPAATSSGSTAPVATAVSTLALPTSTPGPAPVLVPEFNNKQCPPGFYLCIVSFKKDQTVTVQGTYPWLQKGMKLTFKMAPEGVYDLSSYIVAATADYNPDGSKGYGFQVTLNIPDSLRGSARIIVRLDTDVPGYFGTDWFTNQ